MTTKRIYFRVKPKKGRAFQSGRKLRVKRGAFSEGYRTRLAVDPRKARRALYRSGYRVNPGKSPDLSRSPSGPSDLPSLDHPVYQERERRPKWSVKVSPLMDADEGGRILRRRLPNFSKADHESAARYFENEKKRAQGQWSALIEKEHRRVFGRPFEVTDYKISGIGRDEYSAKAKDALRGFAHYAGDAGAASAAHWKAAGHRLRMQKNPARPAREQYELLRDGEPVSRGTYFQLVEWIHRNHSYSMDHALKYEGYSVRPVTQKNPARPAREIVTLTGKHSRRILGYATPDTAKPALLAAAQKIARAHREPVKIERVKVRTIKGYPAPVRAYLANPAPRKYRIHGGPDRPYIQIQGRKVIFSPGAVHDFMRVFPASGLRNRAYWFEFDAQGDLVDTDVPQQDDGPGAAALAEDAKAYLFEGESQNWMENPAPRANISAAARRFSRFTGHRADRVKMIRYPGNPGAGLAVGPVLAIGYTATRDGRTQNYLHKFSPHAAPQLISSHDGRQLILSGGRYKFTERGIVDAARQRK